MPISFPLNPPPITWPYRVQFPGGDDTNRDRNNFQDPIDANRVAQVGAGDVGAAGRAQSGSTGADFYTVRDGVPCMSTTTSPRDWFWSFSWWTPVLDGTALPTDFRQREGALVAVLDAYYRTSFTGYATADEAGVYIGGALGANSGSNAEAQTPGGGGAVFVTGGAGFLLQPAGGFDFVAWDRPTRAIANRVTGLGLSEDEWNWFRFIIQTAAPGGFATFQAYANGDLIVSDTYGSATLPLPFDPDAGTIGDVTVPGLAFVGANPNPGAWFYAFEGKWGRFTLDGVPVQGE